MDDLTDQSASGGASAEEPAPPVGSADLDKFKQDLLTSISQQNDDRWKGWQQSLSKRDQKLTNLENTLTELKTSTLSESEREQLTARTEQQELTALRAERELWTLSREFPDEASLFQRILEAPSAKDQLEILREFKTSLTKVEAPNVDPNSQQDLLTGEPGNSQVDPNNPPVMQAQGNLEQKLKADPSLVDKLLAAAPRWRDQGQP